MIGCYILVGLCLVGIVTIVVNEYRLYKGITSRNMKDYDSY